MEMEILTGDAEPVKQNMQKMPFAVQCEVATTLKEPLVKPGGNGKEM